MSARNVVGYVLSHSSPTGYVQYFIDSSSWSSCAKMARIFRSKREIEDLLLSFRNQDDYEILTVYIET
jgi:hypothetical protein